MSELCSLCQVVEVGPYCPAHGGVHRPFSIAGRYEVDTLIAAGQASFLFGAHAVPAGRAVTVKILRAPARASGAVTEAEQRFLRDAAALAALAHDHIAGIVDFGRDAALGVSYLVTEPPAGPTAAAMIRRAGPLPWPSAVPLLLQIARAIAAAHGRGVVDGQLSLDKVLVVGNGRRLVARLSEFGPAVADADPRDDILGLGVIAHELLTGRPPPEGRCAGDALSDDPVGMNEQDPALALPGRLDELVRACRLRNPMLRPRLDEIEATLRALEPAPGAPDAARPGDPPDIPAMIGSYRVVALLGSGGTGRVYLGEHPVIGSKVAIKVLLPQRSPETVERFIQEARASSQIDSPAFPRYFDFGTTSTGLPYAVMEYFEGETLGQRLGRDGTLPVAQTAQILEQTARALLLAHDAGLIHRDLKPDNLFLVAPDRTVRSARLTASGSSPGAPPLEVKVLDFGIAKVIGNRSATQTLTGAFLGTPSYCAPEQVFGHEVDVRTDVYSLGATAFHMLTGAPPFVGEVPVILSSKATEDPPDPRGAGIPDAVAHTIRRMIARDPDERAPSMLWVLDEVARWPRSDDLGGQTMPMDVPPEAAALDAAPTDRRPPIDRPRDATRGGVNGPAVPVQRGRESPLSIDRRHMADLEAPTQLGRADTAVMDHGEREASTGGALGPVTAPHDRPRARTALMIGGGVLAAAALAAAVLVVGIGESSYRAAEPAPVPAPLAVPAAPLTVPAQPDDAARTAAPAPASPPSEQRSEPGVATPIEPPGAATAPHRPRPKPPDRKPPKKPRSDDAKDVLIVDPFSHGN
ncbi:MAG: hypothetical protein E6J91_11345 [Deltaproteobacteria bacterium]|nr:MAG: hypothetical protein E6J91_11345 [Deltaproteobacteria bacterium]